MDSVQPADTIIERTVGSLPNPSSALYLAYKSAQVIWQKYSTSWIFKESHSQYSPLEQSIFNHSFCLFLHLYCLLGLLQYCLPHIFVYGNVLAFYVLLPANVLHSLTVLDADAKFLFRFDFAGPHEVVQKQL